MDYQEFKAEDFIMERSFQQYCMGVNDEAKIFWMKWIEDNPSKTAEIAKAKEIYTLLNGGITEKDFIHDHAVFNEFIKTKLPDFEINTKGKIAYLPSKKSNRNFQIFRRVAAAIVLFVVLGGGYLVLRNDQKKEQIVGHREEIYEDVKPGGNRAVLTLSNGQQIFLDSISNGTIASQGDVTIIKLNDGQLSYNNTGNAGVVSYNSISTPKGGQYQLILSDGTKVWLNSASSLHFPTSFDEAQRVVELKGEGYFEVAANPSKPFHVKTPTQDVEVIGTHFNINTYDEEESTKTTLLEGSVKVTTSNNQSVKLRPGQQAEVKNHSSKINVINNIEIDHVMAWKNGWFEFDNTDLATIMRQISRWYDIDVFYAEKPSNKKFGGRISKNMSLSKVLHLIETNGVKFKLEGKKLIVQP